MNTVYSYMCVPQVIRDDVIRVVRREFAKDHEAALEILDRYPAPDDPRGSTEGGRARVQLAVMRLSGGDLVLLKYHIGRAIEDFRDVIVLAETPSIDALTPRDESARLSKKDFVEYMAWLKG